LEWHWAERASGCKRVTVFEKSDRIGGLLRYGIPEFKIEKRFLTRRLSIMEQEGVTFRTGVNVGVDLSAGQLRLEFDAIVLAAGAGWARDKPRFRLFARLFRLKKTAQQYDLSSKWQSV
jgi:NADPH-dependent glutamate synthase beta subunit-like oxidoreductase